MPRRKGLSNIFGDACRAVVMVMCLALWHPAFAFDAQGVINSTISLPTSQRIAASAEAFLNTPYDPDPMGEYVTKASIEADERVDCMYHVFRSVELGLSNTPQEAIDRALDLRFHTRGKLDQQGRVLNYDDRFEYGEDMLRSGKWGRDITPQFDHTIIIPGARMHGAMSIVPKERIMEQAGKLATGDVLYLVKDPARRKIGEIVGHLGIIKFEGNMPYLIHASGSKSKGGQVVKLPLGDYLQKMPFIGVMVGRMGVQ